MKPTYQSFIERRLHSPNEYGFKPTFLPDALFDFQRTLVEWSVAKGRAAIFADCGLGKTLMELVWAENVKRKTNKPVLILTPLAVGPQFVSDGEKFGIEAVLSRTGDVMKSNLVSNYERLHHFDPNDFGGVVCDESSILKNFDGATKAAVTEFVRKVPYRLLASATAAPNDYTELGTSSEALGDLGYVDMLGRYFKNDLGNSTARGRAYGKSLGWRFKGHAELWFWRWICSWARAVRKPSDIGGSDEGFVLPALIEREYEVKTLQRKPFSLIESPAVGLREQREELRRSLGERCEKASELVRDTKKPAVIWCHLNDEGKELQRLIPEAVEVSGADSDDAKEEKFAAFAKKQTRVLICKPKIGAFGLNWQHCSHVVYFPSHSYEQYYQAVRRCWRFGQKREVHVDAVTTSGGKGVLANLRGKAKAADRMFSNLVKEMNNAQGSVASSYNSKMEVPSWL